MKYATIVHEGRHACAVMKGNGALSLLRTLRPALNSIMDRPRFGR